MKVLFTSRRPLGRCENITAVYNAYDGPKDFIQEDWGHPDPRIFSSEYSVLVADDFVPYSPGKLIMLTHGASGGKKYGLNHRNGYHNAEQAKLIDYVVSTSEATVALEAEQHGVSVEKVLPLGMPRMDAYYGKVKGDGGTPFAGKRMYLYAPTFRSQADPPLPIIDWKHIDSVLRDDEIFVVKRHMVTPRPILRRFFPHVVEIPPTEPSTPYLIDCDVLVTDYSSIMFDAHALGKPVVLYESNSDYQRTRGMSYPYPDGYASRFAMSADRMLDLARKADRPGPEDIQCRVRSCGACDGHATERVVDLIRRVTDENTDSGADL